MPRSDDYVDGLQTAYKAIHVAKERCRDPQYVAALNLGLAEIDKEIEKAVGEDKPVIILAGGR